MMTSAAAKSSEELTDSRREPVGVALGHVRFLPAAVERLVINEAGQVHAGRFSSTSPG